jgi:hypothetical protein
MKQKKYLLESELSYTKEERRAFMESLRQYGAFKNEIYRSKRLKEIAQQIGEMVSNVNTFTIKETDGWFDKVSVSRDLKSLQDDYKLFEKTCGEITQLQQRLENLYENMGGKLSKYYEI